MKTNACGIYKYKYIYFSKGNYTSGDLFLLHDILTLYAKMVDTEYVVLCLNRFSLSSANTAGLKFNQSE